jgi:hypothetical protein
VRDSNTPRPYVGMRIHEVYSPLVYEGMLIGNLLAIFRRPSLSWTTLKMETKENSFGKEGEILRVNTESYHRILIVNNVLKTSNHA